MVFHLLVSITVVDTLVRARIGFILVIVSDRYANLLGDHRWVHRSSKYAFFARLPLPLCRESTDW